MGDFDAGETLVICGAAAFLYLNMRDGYYVGAALCAISLFGFSILAYTRRGQNQ